MRAPRPTSRAGIEEQDRLLLDRYREFRIAADAVAAHQVDVFVLEPGTDRYLGRLCGFNACPKGKRKRLVPGCGGTPFLRQHEEFEWSADSLAPGKTVRLFDRASGTVAKAGDLPLSETAESG